MNRARIVLVLSAALLLAALPSGFASAEAPPVAKLELSAPPQASVGGEVTLAAKALDATGAGIPGVELVFTQAVTFLNTEDSAELGRAVTNARGEAAFTFIPRSEGEQGLAVQPAATSSRARGTAVIKVGPGPAQHESERTGIEVPGANMWAMAVALTAIWGLFLWAVAQLRTIFREGQKQTIPTSGVRQRHV